MASKETDSTLITGHSYDGIQEYDNPTPAWWHTIWLASMLFAAVYFFMSLASPMYVKPVDRLAAAEVAATKAKFGEIGLLENTEQTLLQYMNDEEWMNFSASVFRGNCVSCHAADGGGNVGPNLKDESWKNVVAITDIAGIIQDGAAGGAMPAWGTRLHPNEVVLLSAYVASLRGQPGGKAAEGEPIAPWPEYTPAPEAPEAEGG